MNLPRLFAASLLSTAVALGTALLPGAAGAAPLKPLTVLTNHTFIGKYAPLFVGVAQGYYKAAGFDVKILPTAGSGVVISTVDSGQADYGVADVSPVVQAIAKGARVKGAFVYMNKSAVALASLQPFPTLESMRGKKIAAAQADSARVAFPVVLGRNHLAKLPFEWVAADPNVYFSLLLSGQVDLISSSLDGDVPALEKIASARGKKVYAFSFYDWGYDIYGLWLVGNDQKLQADPQAAARFAQATRQAMEYAIEHPDDAARIMVKANPILDLDTIETQWRATVAAMGANPTQGGHYGLASRQRLQSTIDIVGTALSLDTSRLKPADVFDAAMIEP